MRLPLIDPASLSPEQRPVYEDMRQGIAANFKGFATIDGQGRLLGPWNPWLHEPKFGNPIWQLTKALSIAPGLPRPVREVAILVTGAHFRAAYELYAHVIAAESRGLSDAKLATIVAGQRPPDLTEDEASAYDVAAALNHGGVLPELTWRCAVQRFGQHGAAELVYLVGLYALVSMTLNGFDVPVPEDAAALSKAG
jgi:alkylhydroperoxidase family enzyme